MWIQFRMLPLLCRLGRRDSGKWRRPELVQGVKRSVKHPRCAPWWGCAGGLRRVDSRQCIRRGRRVFRRLRL
jgi:hypothetical protein